MYRGGLKKWMLQKRERTAAGSASAMALIESPDVFEATLALARWAAICAPNTPAPRTATLRTRNGVGVMAGSAAFVGAAMLRKRQGAAGIPSRASQEGAD